MHAYVLVGPGQQAQRGPQKSPLCTFQSPYHCRCGRGCSSHQGSHRKMWNRLHLEGTCPGMRSAGCQEPLALARALAPRPPGGGDALGRQQHCWTTENEEEALQLWAHNSITVVRGLDRLGTKHSPLCLGARHAWLGAAARQSKARHSRSCCDMAADFSQRDRSCTGNSPLWGTPMWV